MAVLALGAKSGLLNSDFLLYLKSSSNKPLIHAIVNFKLKIFNLKFTMLLAPPVGLRSKLRYGGIFFKLSGKYNDGPGAEAVPDALKF
jgi:hypothetical protein